MPIYLFRHKTCGTIFEIFCQKDNPDRLVYCHKCRTIIPQKELEKLPTAPAVRFKGGGWQTPQTEGPSHQEDK